MSRFNLTDEKWIPVRFHDGTRDELGIRDTLLRAKGIAAIEDSSPLVVAALHRFLLAVLYRALEGPTDIDQAKALFKEGLPSKKITAYLEKWRNRFWLFDEKYPFGQIPTFAPKAWRAWTALAAEHNADTAKVLSIMWIRLHLAASNLLQPFGGCLLPRPFPYPQEKVKSHIPELHRRLVL